MSDKKSDVISIDWAEAVLDFVSKSGGIIHEVCNPKYNWEYITRDNQTRGYGETRLEAVEDAMSKRKGWF